MLASRPRESIESISLAAERLASASVGEEGEGGTLRARFADDDTGGPGGDSTSTEPEDGGGDTATEASLVDKPSNGMRSADGSADGADGPVGGSERAGPEGAGAAAAKPKTGGARFTDEPAEGDAASKAPTTSKPKGARFADDPADVGGDTKAAKPKKGGARFADDPVADVVGGPESSSASKGPDGTGAASAAAKPVKKGARFADDPPESAADGGAANAGADKAPDGAGAAVAAKPAKKGARFADDPPESASSCATDATAATATGVADAAATSSTTTSSLYLRPHPPNIKIPGSAGPAEIPDELVSQPSSIADVAGRPPSESRMSPFARVGVQGAGVADPSETPLTRQLRQLSESDNLADGVIGSPKPLARIQSFQTGVPDGLAPTEDYSLVYAAPEYILNMNCDTLAELGPAADVFSFGKIIFEILTQSLINPSLEVGDAEGWHTTSATLAAYAQKVITLGGARGLCTKNGQGQARRGKSLRVGWV
ncbi:hypothetical protein FOA52_011505 [Chlamydomonas sp. UWO 241]|nr:hypothetical protein FOA52_011505 [Chlamydomonas sp. UWO 241]